MSKCWTQVVDFIGGTGYRGTCRNHPGWMPPGRERASAAIEDCRKHKELNLPSEVCDVESCEREARMAIATKQMRMSRRRMYSVVDFDDRIAPKTSSRYCKTHGLEILIGLVNTLVHIDNDEGPEDGTGSGQRSEHDTNGTDPSVGGEEKASAAPELAEDGSTAHG